MVETIRSSMPHVYHTPHLWLSHAGHPAIGSPSSTLRRAPDGEELVGALRLASEELIGATDVPVPGEFHEFGIAVSRRDHRGE